MEYRTIPGVRLPVSRFFFGTASGPFIVGEDRDALLDAALAAGINAIDTARNYGLAERSVGRWMASRGTRDRVVILSKAGHPDDDGRKRITEKDIRDDFAESSRLLGTGFIDIYLLHRDDPDTDVSVAVEVLNALHAEGKIGIFGGSNWTHGRIEEANEYAYAHGLQPFAVSSPNYGLARQCDDPWGGGCVSLTGPENAGARAWYRDCGMPVIAYSSLGRGLFSGRLRAADAAHADRVMDEFALKGYGCEDNFLRLARCEELAAAKGCTVPQLAMAWLLHQPENVFPVITMSSPERIAENLAAADVALTPEECRYLNLED